MVKKKIKVKRGAKSLFSDSKKKKSKKSPKKIVRNLKPLTKKQVLNEEKKLKSIFEIKLSKTQKKSNLRRTAKRISTGVKKLDKLVQGGYKEGSINLVEGGPGSGKTIFGTQFLLDGIKNNENVAYVTFEVNKEKFYENMLALGWDLEKYEKQGLFTFLSYTPEQIKRILVEGGGTIDSIITKRKIKRILIDSITSFALLYGSELAKKEAALTLFSVIDTWQVTALLTAQNEGDSDKGEIASAALDFEVDGIIILYHVKQKGTRKRGIEVLKMRGTKTPAKIYDFDISKGGIKLKSSTFTR